VAEVSPVHGIVSWEACVRATDVSRNQPIRDRFFTADRSPNRGRSPDSGAEPARLFEMRRVASGRAAQHKTNAASRGLSACKLAPAQGQPARSR